MTSSLAQAAASDASRLVAHLRYHQNGQRWAAPLSAIAAQLGWDERHLQEVAREARAQGAPVCSSSGSPAGMWYGDPAEVARTARSLIRRGVKTIQAGRDMLRANALPGQEKMFDLLSQLDAELDAVTKASASPQRGGPGNVDSGSATTAADNWPLAGPGNGRPRGGLAAGPEPGRADTGGGPRGAQFVLLGGEERLGLPAVLPAQDHRPG